MKNNLGILPATETKPSEQEIDPSTQDDRNEVENPPASDQPDLEGFTRILKDGPGEGSERNLDF